MIYGYARVSTKKQKVFEQVKQLQEYFKEKGISDLIIYSETVRGTKELDKRCEFKKLKKELKKGDILVVTEFDRLGRYENMYEDIKQMLKKVKIETISEGVIYEEKLEIYVERAINELNVLKDRAKRRKKSKEKKVGRPKVDEKDLNDFFYEYQKYKRGDYGKITMKRFAKEINKSRTLCYYYLKILREREKIQI